MIGPQLPPGGLQRTSSSSINAGDVALPQHGKQLAGTGGTGGASQVPLVHVMDLRLPMELEVRTGLCNLGNTCFMNSVLQSLAYAPPLAAALHAHRRLHGFVGACPLRQRQRPCACCLVELTLGALIDAEPGRVVRPNLLFEHIRVFSKAFQRGRQEDAHEFLLAVLEAVERDSRLGLVEYGYPKATRTLVEQLFCGQLRSSVRCLECKHVSSTFETLSALSLSVQGVATLHESLEAYIKAETLDGDNKYKCNKCNKLVRARKWLSLSEEPNVLVIHLKRFDAALFVSKVHHHVAFTTTLTLRRPEAAANAGAAVGPPGVASPTARPPPPSYRLQGVVVHSGGSVHSGHYYSYVRDGRGRWWCANDSSVSQVTEFEVMQQQAYLLVYARTILKPLALPPAAQQHAAAASTGSRQPAGTAGLARHLSITSPTATAGEIAAHPLQPHIAANGYGCGHGTPKPSPWHPLDGAEAQHGDDASHSDRWHQVPAAPAAPGPSTLPAAAAAAASAATRGFTIQQVPGAGAHTSHGNGLGHSNGHGEKIGVTVLPHVTLLKPGTLAGVHVVLKPKGSTTLPLSQPVPAAAAAQPQLHRVASASGAAPQVHPPPPPPPAPQASPLLLAQHSRALLAEDTAAADERIATAACRFRKRRLEQQLPPPPPPPALVPTQADAQTEGAGVAALALSLGGTPPACVYAAQQADGALRCALEHAHRRMWSCTRSDAQLLGSLRALATSALQQRGLAPPSTGTETAAGRPALLPSPREATAALLAGEEGQHLQQQLHGLVAGFFARVPSASTAAAVAEEGSAVPASLLAQLVGQLDACLAQAQLRQAAGATGKDQGAVGEELPGEGSERRAGEEVKWPRLS